MCVAEHKSSRSLFSRQGFDYIGTKRKNLLKLTAKIFGHGTLLLIETLAALIVLVIALGTLVFWRFSSGPVDITFAKPYVQDSLFSKDSGLSVNAQKVQLAWPEYRGPFTMQLDGVTLLENEKEILNIGQIGLHVSKAPLLIGQVVLEAVVLDQPTLKIMREQSGKVRFIIGQDDATETEVATVDSGTDSSVLKFDTVSDASSWLFVGKSRTAGSAALRVLSELHSFVINDASLVVEDHTVGVTWVLPQLDLDLKRTNTSLALDIGYIPPGLPQKSSIQVTADITQKNLTNLDELNVEVVLDKVDLGFFARNFAKLAALRGQDFTIDGNLKAILNKDWDVQALEGAITADNGALNLPDYFDEPISLQDLSLNLIFNRALRVFSLTNTNAKVKDIPIQIEGKATWEKGHDIILPLSLKLGRITMEQVRQLFPKRVLEGEPLEEWLTKNLTAGTLNNVDVGLVIRQSLQADGQEKIDLDDATASFTYEGLDVDYRAPLIPVSGARGSGSLKDQTLDIQVESGMIGNLVIKKGRVQLTDLLTDGSGDAIIDAELSGPISTIVDYISREPISLGSLLEMKPADVAGSADAIVNVQFPSLKDLPADMVKVKVDATLTETKMPNVVRGLALTGGPLKLNVAEGAVKIRGTGQLGGRPIDLSWARYINEKDAPFISEITANIGADKELRDLFEIDLDDYIKGTVPVSLVYKEPTKGNVDIDVTMDITPVEFFVTPMNYTKPVGTAGTIKAKAKLTNDIIQKISDLNIAIGDDKATGGVLTFGKVGNENDVQKAVFDSVRLGKDNNFALVLEQPAPKTLKVSVTGASGDARPFLEPDTDQLPYDGPAITMTAKVDVMRTADESDQFIKGATVSASVDKNGRIANLSVNALAGNGPLNVQMAPGADGVMALTVDAADAGSTLKAFNVYDRMQGGTLAIRGKQIPNAPPNDIQGVGVIKNFRVVNAPVLAKLVNALSLSGIGQLLGNEGLVFEKLRSNFTWRENDTGRVINFTDGKTSGTSLGLSFGGSIDQGKDQVDISGTIVPMSEINSIVGKIPLLGPLLTGGKNGGIIAATYAIKGKTEEPGVFINPLSVLTPGFLRAILFEGGIDFDDDDDDQPAKAPPPKSRSNTPQSRTGAKQ